jgi:hypothetical protein
LAIGCKHGRRNDKRCFYSQQWLWKSCKCCTRSVGRTIFFLRRGSMAVENYLTIDCKHLMSYCSSNGDIITAILHKIILSASNRWLFQTSHQQHKSYMHNNKYYPTNADIHRKYTRTFMRNISVNVDVPLLTRSSVNKNAPRELMYFF